MYIYRNMLIDIDGDDTPLISIYFLDDTPDCIKDKLDEIITESIYEYTVNESIKEELLELKNLELCARMQINRNELGVVEYYIAVLITGFTTNNSGKELEVNINKDYLVDSTSEIYDEFISYCRRKINEFLFPAC